LNNFFDERVVSVAQELGSEDEPLSDQRPVALAGATKKINDISTLPVSFVCPPTVPLEYVTLLEDVVEISVLIEVEHADLEEVDDIFIDPEPLIIDHVHDKHHLSKCI
jgi:hypothetical protein